MKRPGNKARKSSSFRTSFGVSDDGDTDTSGSGVVTPKRSNLSKVAIQRNAERRFAVEVPFRSGTEESDDRPSYSKSMIEELRNSTPSTPQDLSGDLEDTEAGTNSTSKAVDLASKFGSSLSRYEAPSAIPTDAEIKEKKERRARLAKEQDFILLEATSEDDDLDDNVTRDENGKLILKPKEKYAETRLVREDEDIFEDFDDFTTDGKVLLGRKAEKEAEQRRRAEMATMIAEAEGASDDSTGEDDSEAERNAVFAEAQSRSGNYASQTSEDPYSMRPHTPPRITPLPTLEGIMSRLRSRLEDMKIAKDNKSKELDNLRVERGQIEREEIRVQAALKETADKYTELRRAVTAKADAPNEESGQLVQTNGHDSANGPPAHDLMDPNSRGRGGLGLGLGAAHRTESGDDESDDSEY